MSKTAFATGNALTKKAWEEKLFRDMVKESYFSKFSGEGQDSIVSVKTELTKEKGDKITFGLRMRLAGSGVTSGTVLEGNEEALSTYSDSVTLEQYRHAVRDDGAMSRQRAMFDISKESESAIKDWGTEKTDQLLFDALGIGDGAAVDPATVIYLNSSSVFTKTIAATAKAGLHATNSKLTTDFISALRTFAVTGNDRARIPIRPVKVEGRSYHVLLVHPDCMYDLKVNSNFQQAMREAQERGPSNPLFKGATAIWDNVVIHEHENVAIAADGGGASVPWAKCALLGAQALVHAWGRRPKVIQKEFDYDNEKAYAIDMIMGAKKAQFNSLDYGVLGVWLARTNISGA